MFLHLYIFFPNLPPPFALSLSLSHVHTFNTWSLLGLAGGTVGADEGACRARTVQQVIFTYTCISVYMCVYVHPYSCMYVCMYHTYVCMIHTYMHHTYVCMIHTYACMYVCIHRHKHDDNDHDNHSRSSSYDIVWRVHHYHVRHSRRQTVTQMCQIISSLMCY